MQMILVYCDLIHSLVNSYMIHTCILKYLYINAKLHTYMPEYVCLYSIGTFRGCSTVVEDCAVTKENPKKRAIPVSI